MTKTITPSQMNNYVRLFKITIWVIKSEKICIDSLSASIYLISMKICSYYFGSQIQHSRSTIGRRLSACL